MRRLSFILLVFSFMFACTQQDVTQEQTKKGYKDFLAEANAIVNTIDVADAVNLVGDESVAFIDVREQEELDSSGKVPGALHAPRGMLEFYIDAASPYHKEVFSSGKKIVFYCASGGRSALAARLAMEMGLSDVAHVGRGFKAWVKAGGPVEQPTTTK
jgi:rhodanese-related sulfurtransferase